MLPLLSFLLLGSLAAASIPTTYEEIPQFLAGKEYVFKYETQVLTGVPVGETPYSGLKIRAKVIVQPKSIRNLFDIKLKDVELYKVTKVLSLDKLEGALPDEHFVPITGKEAELIKREVIKPFRIKYRKGIINKAYVLNSDPLWSVNIKKGILNLLQVKIHEEPKPQQPSWSIFRNIPEAAPIIPSFEAEENDFAGDCKSLYTIDPVPATRQTPGIFTVTKIKDFDSCKRLPLVLAGLLPSVFCDKKCPFIKSHVVMPHTWATLKLVGTLEQFIIQEATLTGRYILAPFEPKSGHVATILRQHLLLLSVKTVETPMTIPQADLVVLAQPLQPLLQEEVSMLASTLPSAKLSAEVQAKRIEEVKRLINIMVEKVKKESRKDVTLLSKSLVILLAELDLVTLQKIKEHYFTQPAVPSDILLIRDLLIDILPSVPTPEAAKILLSLIREKKIAGQRAALLINMLAITSKPSLVTVRELLAIYKVEPVLDAVVRQAALLSAGAIMNSLYKQVLLTIPRPRHSDLSAVLPVTAAKPIIDEVRAILDAATSEEEKVLILKAIGNAGWLELLPLVKPIISRRTEPEVVRAKAIYAVRKMARVQKKKVLPLLFPLYLNRAAPLELRVAAFVVILEGKPMPVTYHLIAHYLNREPNHALARFVYATMVSLAKSELPCYKAIARQMQYILLIIRPIKGGLQASKVLAKDIYSESLDFGARVATEMVHEPETVLPSAVISGVHLQVLGTVIHPIEIGLEAKGKGLLIKRLFATHGEWNMQSLLNMLRPERLAHLPPLHQEIQDLKEKISLILPKIPDTKLSIYIKLFGNEMRFITIDKSVLEKIIKLDIIKVIKESGILTSLKNGLSMDLQKIIHLPLTAASILTPIGLPLHIDLSAVAAIKSSGRLSITGSSDLQPTILDKKKIPKIINIKANIHPWMSSMTLSHMAISLGPIVAGAAHHLSADACSPIDLTANLDVATWKIKLEAKLPDRDHKVLRIEQKPISFVKILPVSDIPIPQIYKIDRLFIQDVKAAKKINIPAELSKLATNPLKRIKEALGIELAVNGDIVMNPALPGPSRVLLSGRSIIEVVFKPSVSAPKILIEAIVKIPYSLAEYIEPPAASSSLFSSLFSSPSSEVTIPELEAILPNIDRVTSKLPASPAPRRASVAIMIKSVTSESPVKAAAQVAWISAPDWMKHQMDIQLLISPVPTISTEMVKVKLDTLLHLPRFLALPVKPIVPSNMELKADMALSMGKISSVSRVLALKIANKPVIDLKYSDVAKVYPGLQEEIFNILKYLLKYEVNIEYSSVPRSIVERLVKVHQFLKYHLYHYLSVDPLASPPPPGKMASVIEIKPIKKVLEMSLRTPMETDVLKVPLPLPAELYLRHIRILTDRPLYDSIKHMITKDLPLTGQCLVSHKMSDVMVSSLDERIYKLPDIACDMVLAKDCSYDQLFTVLMRIEGLDKVLQVYLPEYKIVISKEAINSHKIIVNNEVKDVSATPLILKDSNKNIIAELSINDSIITLKSPSLKLELITDMKTIKLKVGIMHRGHMCGLCSLFHGIPEYNDLKDPLQRPVYTPAQMVTSWLVPSSKCSAETITNLQRIHNYYKPPNACTKYQNLMAERVNTEGSTEICFSTQPVKACIPSCVPSSSSTKVRVQFHCLAQSDPLVKELLPIYNKGVLSMLISRPAHLTQMINVPDSCEPIV